MTPAVFLISLSSLPINMVTTRGQSTIPTGFRIEMAWRGSGVRIPSAPQRGCYANPHLSCAFVVFWGSVWAASLSVVGRL
jgi:hypothetical protein